MSKKCMTGYEEIKIMNDNNNFCDECGSEFYRRVSEMTSLCPECSHVLYGYVSCNHEFKNGRCVKCFWNGNVSDYIKQMKSVKTEADTLSQNMQNEVIKIATERVGRPLSKSLVAKVRQNKWSYRGLEMMMDAVKSLDVNEIENYLSHLD